MDEKENYLRKLYNNENLHREVYARLAHKEDNPQLKKILEKLAKMEESHRGGYEKLLKLNGMRVPDERVGLYTEMTILLRRIVGLALTVKIIEYFEMQLERGFEAFLKKEPLDSREAAIIGYIDRDEEYNERVLEDAVIGYGKIINNIRDVAFGMNDGLVELLGVVVGLAAALNNPLLILVGGIIVAVAGTLSMGGGAYLSTEYEMTINKKKGEADKNAALRSGIYVGVTYFIGTLFPLAPFALGFSGTPGIMLSVVITAIALTVISTIIAVISDTSIFVRVSRTLLISLGIAAITILIGVYARAVMHLPV